MTTIFPSLEDYDVGDVSGLGEGVTLSQEEMDEEEYRIRSNPVSWAYWKLKDPKGNPWEARWYQAMMIDGIVDGDRRIAARMGRRVGKCMPGHVKVFDPTTGEQVPIQELYERQQANVLTMNSEFKINPSKSSHVWDNGIKEVFKVTLKSGRVVEATGNHPLYRIDGWTEIDDLAVGDRIATPRIINHFGSHDMAMHEIKYLAYMIGDGNFTSANLRFSNANDEIIKEFKDVVDSFRDAKVKQYEYSNHCDYNIHNSDNSPKTRYKNKARLLLESTNLFGKGSHEKFVPNDIFKLKREQLVIFISRLFSTDGWISSKVSNGRWRVEVGYSTVSEQLARDVHHLLLRFGIQAKLRLKNTKYKDGIKESYVISLHSKNDISTFLKEIGFIGKDSNVEAAEEALSLIKEKDDTLPVEIMQEVENLRISKRIRPKEMLHPNASMHERYKRQYAPQRKNLDNWADVLGDKRLKDLASSDIYWDEIVSIVSQGDMQTYDLTIPETKNFIANDVIVHNTETMVVYCLWRAFHQRNQRMLIVAPYENQVRLIFMRLEELVNDSEELASSIKITKNPFIATFGNGSKIMGFTGGANSGSQSGASVRGQRADSKYTKAA